MNLKHIIKTTLREYITENSKDEVKLLQKQLKVLDDWFYNSSGIESRLKQWDEKVDQANEIRRKLYSLTGDAYGETKDQKEKKNIKPKGLNNNYNHPNEVPKNVYRWILKNTSLLYTDATDAVRWSRIINSKDDQRYPKGDITIYRTTNNTDYDDIREGDWVTTDETYAKQHNDMYFNGKGNIISLDVDGRDVLVSPTGNHEEAIYAPLKYSIDIKL